MEWTAVAGETIYATSLAPLGISLVAAMGLGGLAAWQHRVLRSARPRRARFAIGLPAVMTFVFLVVATLAHLGYGIVTAARFWGSWPREAWSLFGTLFVLEHVVAVGAGVVAAILFARHARSEPSPPLLPALALPLVAIGWLGVGHAAFLVSLGPLPGLAVDHVPWIHQGKPCKLSGSIEWRDKHVTSMERGWTFSRPRAIDSRTLGVRHVELSADRFMMSMQRRLDVAVREERGDPALPLRVGNRWSYLISIGRRTSLWGGGAQEGDTLTLEIISERVELGVRSFELRASRPGKVQTGWLYALEGRVYQGSSPTGHPERPGEKPAPFELGPVGGASAFFFPLIGSQCTGVAVPGPRYEVAGPCDCSSSSDYGAATGLSAALSFGLIAPGIKSEHAELVDSHLGPDDAPHAEVGDSPPPPPPPPRPAGEQDACVDQWVCVVFELEPGVRPSEASRRFPPQVIPRLESGVLMMGRDRGSLAADLDVAIEASPAPNSVCANRPYGCRFSLANDAPSEKLKGIGIARLRIDQRACGYPEPPGR